MCVALWDSGALAPLGEALQRPVPAAESFTYLLRHMIRRVSTTVPVSWGREGDGDQC